MCYRLYWPPFFITLEIKNLLHEPLLWHSRQFSLLDTKYTRKLSKPEFGLQTTQVPSLVMLLCTSCRAGFTETGTMLDLQCLFLLANLQEGKWCSLSSMSSYSACSFTMAIICLSVLQVFTQRLLHLFSSNVYHKVAPFTPLPQTPSKQLRI